MISRRKLALALNALVLTAMFSVAPLALAQEAPKVKLATSMGDIVVQLNPEKAPKTVANFLQYVRELPLSEVRPNADQPRRIRVLRRGADRPARAAGWHCAAEWSASRHPRPRS